MALLILSLGLSLLTVVRTASPWQKRHYENVHVLQDLPNGYDYWLKLTDGDPYCDGKPCEKFWTRFCTDYEPQFSAGQILDELNVEDRGSCWSVANTHPAYRIRRDLFGSVIREVEQ